GGQATEGGDLVDDLYAGLLFILLGERLLDELIEGRDERAFVEDSDRLAGRAARLRRECGPGGVRRGDLRKSRREVVVMALPLILRGAFRPRRGLLPSPIYLQQVVRSWHLPSSILPF